MLFLFKFKARNSDTPHNRGHEGRYFPTTDVFFKFLKFFSLPNVTNVLGNEILFLIGEVILKPSFLHLWCFSGMRRLWLGNFEFFVLFLLCYKLVFLYPILL